MVAFYIFLIHVNATVDFAVVTYMLPTITEFNVIVVFFSTSGIGLHHTIYITVFAYSGI